MIKSSVKSDHSAVVVYNGQPVCARGKTSVVHSYRKKSPNQNRDFITFAGTIDFKVAKIEDPQLQFDEFY